MPRMLVLSLSILNSFLNVLSCTKTGPIKDFRFGQRLVDALITRKTSVDFFTCVKHCEQMKNCRSVNYLQEFLLCELNYKNTTNKDANITVTSNAVYSERIHWNENIKLLSNACKRKSCPNNTECIEDEDNHASCVVTDCGVPSKTKDAEYDLENGIGLYSKVMYGCEQDYYMEGKPFIGCQNNGKWSPVRFQCFLAACDTGWKHYSHSCYRIPEWEAEFELAKIDCEQEDATLADVLSEEENQFIWSLRGTGQDVLLLGGIYYSDISEWKWIKSDVAFFGSGVKSRLFTNWLIGEPNYLRWEFCMGMYHSSKWNDFKCDLQGYFVCKKNARA